MHFLVPPLSATLNLISAAASLPPVVVVGVAEMRVDEAPIKLCGGGTMTPDPAQSAREAQ